jgi:hypothetical protein
MVSSQPSAERYRQGWSAVRREFAVSKITKSALTNGPLYEYKSLDLEGVEHREPWVEHKNSDAHGSPSTRRSSPMLALLSPAV